MKTVVNASFCPRPKYEATNNGKQTVEPYENANFLAHFRSKIRWKIFFQKISLKIFKGKSSWIGNNKNSLYDKIFQNTTQLFLKAAILIHFLWVLVEHYWSMTLSLNQLMLYFLELSNYISLGVWQCVVKQRCFNRSEIMKIRVIDRIFENTQR